MKFIVPQNFNIENKIFGFLDYASCLFLVFLSIIILAIINLFNIAIIYKISGFLILFLPLFILSITGFYRESLIDVIFYLFRFLLSQKVYLYM